MFCRITRIDLLLLVALVGLGVGGRLLPHPPNCTPVAASALFAGFLISHRSIASLVPFGTMLVSDFFLGFYDLPVMASVYVSMLFPLLLGGFLRRRPSALRVGAGSVACSMVFFLVTNSAVWAFSGMYEATVDGLMICYVAGLPFLKYTLLGDALWSTALFGSYAAVTAIATAYSRPVESEATCAARS